MEIFFCKWCWKKLVWQTFLHTGFSFAEIKSLLDPRARELNQKTILWVHVMLAESLCDIKLRLAALLSLCFCKDCMTKPQGILHLVLWLFDSLVNCQYLLHTFSFLFRISLALDWGKVDSSLELVLFLLASLPLHSISMMAGPHRVSIVSFKFHHAWIIIMCNDTFHHFHLQRLQALHNTAKSSSYQKCFSGWQCCAFCGYLSRSLLDFAVWNLLDSHVNWITLNLQFFIRFGRLETFESPGVKNSSAASIVIAIQRMHFYLFLMAKCYEFCQTDVHPSVMFLSTPWCPILWESVWYVHVSWSISFMHILWFRSLLRMVRSAHCLDSQTINWY